MTALHFRTIGDIAAMLRAGEATSRDLTELMLGRIERLNPVLNAYITVTADRALASADKADGELAAGYDRGPLQGVPVAIKDLIDTKGVRTTHGSRLYEDNVPSTDATAVRRLDEAGVVSLGKTGLHEFAFGTSSINAFYGAIANPWAPDHDPGGSSGGSASAVAAGLAFGALGTDTGCSIRQPAHCCGIVGFKPSFGAVSKAGVFPLSRSMDHVGPITRNVADAALIHAALAGPDPADTYTAQAAAFVPDTNLRALDGLKLGIIRNYFFDGQPEVIEAVDAALNSLEAQGVTLVELDMPDLDAAFEAAEITVSAEAWAIHEKSFTANPELYSQELRRGFSWRPDVAAYARAQHFRHGFTQRMERLLDQCDALAAPTARVPSAPILDRPRGHDGQSWRNCGIFDLTGQPSISLPCGFTSTGLPVGLMLSGRRGGDAALLGTAASVEAGLGWSHNPPDPA